MNQVAELSWEAERALHMKRCEKLVEHGEFRTLPDASLFWSSGGERTGRDLREVGNMNWELACEWRRHKNENLPPGRAPYTMMADLPEGRALSQLVLSNIDRGADVSRGEGNALIVRASDRFSRQALGVVNIVARNAGPGTNLQRIELALLLENDRVTHFNLIELVNEDAGDRKEDWEFSERPVEKHHFARIMQDHWLDVVLARCEAGITDRHPPFLPFDKRHVEYSTYSIAECQAAVAGSILNITDEIERLEYRGETGEALHYAMQRLRCCAEFVVRYPIAVDIFAPEVFDHRLNPPWGSYRFAETILRSNEYSADRYDAILWKEEVQAAFVHQELTRLVSIMQRCFPGLDWGRLHLHSPAEFLEQSGPVNPCGAASSLAEFREREKNRREQAPEIAAAGVFHSPPDRLVLKFGDRPELQSEPLNGDYLRQRTLAQRYCAAMNAGAADSPYVSLTGLPEGQALAAVQSRQWVSGNEPSRGREAEVKQHAYRQLCSGADGIVTVAGKFREIGCGFSLFCTAGAARKSTNFPYTPG